MIKTIYQEDIKLINTCTPNIYVPKYIKQLLTEQKGETDKNTIKNTIKYPTDSNGQMIQTENKEISALNDVLDQMDIIFTGLFIREYHNIHSSLVHMEHSQEQTLC